VDCIPFDSQVDQQSLGYTGGEAIKGLIVDDGEEGGQQGELESSHTAFYQRILKDTLGISSG
jgi:hypothetical protein